MNKRIFVFINCFLLILLSSIIYADEENITMHDNVTYIIHNPFNYKVVYLNDTYTLVEQDVYQEIEAKGNAKVFVTFRHNCNDIQIPYAGIINLHILRPDLDTERQAALDKITACKKNVSANFRSTINLSEIGFKLVYDFGESISGYATKNAIDKISESSLVYEIYLVRRGQAATDDLETGNESQTLTQEQERENELIPVREKKIKEENKTEEREAYETGESYKIFEEKQIIKMNISRMITNVLFRIRNLLGWLR